MTSYAVVIVGGGLAGLLTARRLHGAGIAFEVLEARDRLGGRILSVDAGGVPAPDGFDLGPSWFWPDTQPALSALVRELGLAAFKQNGAGDVVVDHWPGEKPERYPGAGPEANPSMRFAGGTGALIAALAAALPPSTIRRGARVTHVRRDDHGVEVSILSEGVVEEKKRASHVVVAIPPRLLAETITFSPEPDADTFRRWRATPTWMAPHAKVFALYDRAFWRETGLSGTAQSMVGPLVEIHDATTASGQAALFGFVGVPAERRAAVGQAALVTACVDQLARLVGPQAASPRATLYKDWAADPLTTTPSDWLSRGHPVTSREPWVPPEWRSLVTLAGSETADVDPGYLAGAVHAAERAAAGIIKAGRTPR